MDWSQAGNAVGSGAVFVAAVVFCTAYSVLAKWWRTEVGRHLVAMAAAVGLLGAYTLVITVWPGTAPVLRVVRMVLVLAVAGLLVQRTWMLVKAQAAVRGKPPQE